MDAQTLKSNGLNEQLTLLQSQTLKTQSKKLALSGSKSGEIGGIDNTESKELLGDITGRDSVSLQVNPKVKTTYEFDASAVKIDLNLDFSVENLKKTLNHVIGREKQLMNGNEDSKTDRNQKERSEITPFLNVGLSVEAERIQKNRFSGGTGKIREIHVRHHRYTLSKQYVNRRLENIKLQIQRRQQERADARLDIMYRNGYRIVYRRISQKYHENLSLKAELMYKFSKVANKVAEHQPESTGKFIKTTDKLVQNKKVSGKTVSKFFDVVESYIDKTRKALHKRINKFLNRIAIDFNVDDEKLKEMRTNLHSKVDKFFNNVDSVLDKLEGEAIKFLRDKNENMIDENIP
ncbi:hypothetical protein ACFL4Z_03185, partial [candidate division KSB1 bacterium]